MSNTEGRENLAALLDNDISNFIDNLPRKSYEDGWPEDRWEEEMEKHPMFMSRPVEKDQELPPLIEAMQQLKYDPIMNSPEELAFSYKEDGNANFKRKKYKWAVESYTQGMNAKCDVEELNVALYSNRAAAHFHIGNFKKSLSDATEAKILAPYNVKAIHRGAMCCLELNRIDECILWCIEGLKVEEGNTKLHDLKKKALEKKKFYERDSRKAANIAAKKKRELDNVLSAVKSSGIRLAEDDFFNIATLENIDPALANATVHFDVDGAFIWPVMLLYPEYGITDYIKQFHEDSCLLDHLDVMFSPENAPTWDKHHTYQPQNLQVYFESDQKKIVPVDKELPLTVILRDKRFILRAGTPSFIVTVKDSPFDKSFVSKNELST